MASSYSSGILNSASKLSVTSVTLTINPDDSSFLTVGAYNYTFNTSGNTNYTSYSLSDILIVSSSGGTTGTTVSVCKYKKLGYYNPKLIWIKQENCV